VIIGPASKALLIISPYSLSDIEKNSIILFFRTGIRRKSGRFDNITMIFPA
jgi:hypothetical protein